VYWYHEAHSFWEKPISKLFGWMFLCSYDIGTIIHNSKRLLILLGVAHPWSIHYFVYYIELSCCSSYLEISWFQHTRQSALHAWCYIVNFYYANSTQPATIVAIWYSRNNDWRWALYAWCYVFSLHPPKRENWRFNYFFFFLSPWQNNCLEWCRNWPTEGFPGCVIKRLSACTRVPHSQRR